MKRRQPITVPIAGLVLLAICFARLPMASCQPPSDVENGRRTNLDPAAEALGNTPWYDADSKAVRPVKVQRTFDDSANRDSRWLPSVKRVRKAPTTSTPTTTAGGFGGVFGTGLSIGNLFGWLLLVMILVAVVGLLAYAFSRAELEFGRSSRDNGTLITGTPDAQTIERMKHLPPELRRTDVNLRSEALRLMQLGSYDQAIILLFGHQLLLLDRAGSLRLARGKTNGRYVRETRQHDPAMADCLAATVNAFERSYFGRHMIGEAEFEHLWRNNESLEQSVQAAHEVAA